MQTPHLLPQCLLRPLMVGGGKQWTLSCSLDGASRESRTEHFHLDTLSVAESVPHIGLPVQVPTRRHALRKSFPGPGGPDSGPPGPDLGGSGPGLGGPNLKLECPMNRSGQLRGDMCIDFTDTNIINRVPSAAAVFPRTLG
jgi:hypothetical protein